MTAQELILIEGDKVRRDSNLMAFYIDSFFITFGYRPNCAGCTFDSDWRKFVRAINSGSITQPIKSKKEMGTFKLKKVQNKIFAYRTNGKTYRLYDTGFTEDFVKNFLTHGTEEEIKERKALFAVLPDGMRAYLSSELLQSTDGFVRWLTEWVEVA